MLFGPQGAFFHCNTASDHCETLAARLSIGALSSSHNTSMTRSLQVDAWAEECYINGSSSNSKQQNSLCEWCGSSNYMGVLDIYCSEGGLQHVLVVHVRAGLSQLARRLFIQEGKKERKKRTE